MSPTRRSSTRPARDAVAARGPRQELRRRSPSCSASPRAPSATARTPRSTRSPGASRRTRAGAPAGAQPPRRRRPRRLRRSRAAPSATAAAAHAGARAGICRSPGAAARLLLAGDRRRRSSSSVVLRDERRRQLGNDGRCSIRRTRYEPAPRPRALATASSTSTTASTKSSASKAHTVTNQLDADPARTVQQSDRHRRDPRRRQQARVLPRRRTPAAVERLLLRVWLYNSPTSAEALSKSPAVGSDGTPAGRRAAAGQRRRLPPDPAHARDQRTPDRIPGRRCCRAVRPHGRQLMLSLELLEPPTACPGS